ncbi:cyclic GMP-AMP synthase [Dryobates pubescens]|uniref:cyclic GMP-AMP synthase n=1 Tax=Dryobates pubescens TaxID=118200 RepID=UPI0023B93952|nr:cyclic GMP-AMP synthase [Dryobates pubescens]
MDGAGGRGERGGRRARPAAPRGRGAARAVARSPSPGCRSPGGAATPQPGRKGAAARRGRPARPASTVRSPPAGPAANGGRLPPAPRGRAPPTRAPAAQRRAAVPDGAAAAAVAVPRSPSAAGALRLREVLARLTLDRQDVSEASRLVNRVTLKLTEAIRSHGGPFSSMEQLGAGSYYEHVKISEPNEFDIMLVIPIERLQLEPSDDTGAFYYLKFKRNPKEKGLTKFVDEDETLSASKMLDALREIIKQAVKSIPDVAVTVKRKKPGSPAITLLISNPSTEPPSVISVDIILTLKVNQSWPSSTEDGLRIEQWLGRKVRRHYRLQPLYLVAKQNRREKVQRGNCWRLSFSHVEKATMNNHGNTKTCCESDGVKCCRKASLKLLKFLLEKLKLKYPERLEKISSYYVKTSFFHSCARWPNDTDWPVAGLEHCFQRSLLDFLDGLQRSYLPHFFVPQYNLLGPEDKASSEFLSRQILLEWNNLFPVLQERS